MAMSGERMRASKEHLLVVLATGLFAAILCFVRPTIFESADYVLFYKANFQFLADAVRQGRVPLWNPYIGLGRPFLADTQSAVWYPPLYLICLGQEVGMFLLVWLHCLLAVFGMRCLAAGLRVGRWQSYFMASNFLGSGALTARWVTGQIPYCWALCYVPGLFYCALRTEERWQGWRIACYALLLALQFLCGHPQVFWFSAIGQAVFILARALRLPLREALRDAAQGLSQFGTACVWCAGLVAVVLLPMLELVKQSNRAGNSPAFVSSGNLSWADLGNLFGSLYAGFSWESNLFVGAIVVLSGCAGLCLVRERNVRGLLAVLVAGMLIALGDRTPFFGLIYKWLPGFANFRIHARAALLVVLVLICASGIWLSRPHPRLRDAWTRIFGVPIRYALIGLVLLQSVDLLQGTWETKRVITYAALFTLAPLEHTFVRTLVAELRGEGLMEPLQPPPRVCVAPSLVPANYGMIYHYSHFDANCSLFLRRPWDYLHAVLGIPPEGSRGYLAPVVYRHGVFPYPDLALSVGFDPRNGKLVVNTNPAPRAFLVSAAEVADYDAILDRLAHGYDIHRAALLEEPLAEPLPPTNSPPGIAAIRRFEPESLLVDVEAKEKALLVLAEAWYPGWRAEIDGQACACLPANIWMRAVPVPAGRHQVRLYYRQDYLLPGLLISLASAGLLLAILAKSGGPMPLARILHAPHEMPAGRSAGFQTGLASAQEEGADQECGRHKPVWKPALRPRKSETSGLTPGEPALARASAAPGARASLSPNLEATPLTQQPRAFSSHWQYLRAVAVAAFGVALIASIAIQRMRLLTAQETVVDAEAQFHLAMTLHMQHQMAQAIAHYTETLRLQPDHAVALNNLAWIRAANARAEFRDGPEAVRLAQRACELTGYKEPMSVQTLATALAEAGRFEDAVAMAEQARQLALAGGQRQLAENDLKIIKMFTNRQPYHEADRN